MKKIGILGSAQSGLVGITFPYFELGAEFGEVVIINPLSKEINKNIDLLILVGGADLNPMDYESQPSIRTNKPNPVREWFDLNMLGKYINEKVPIFGICLGLQSLVAYFGGKLNQHNSRNHPFSQLHRSDLVHSLKMKPVALVDKRFPFLKKFAKIKLKVNSLHHQSVSVMPESFNEHFSTENNDKSPEIIVHKRLPIVAFQFHPEELHNVPAKDLALKYIEALLNIDNGI